MPQFKLTPDVLQTPQGRAFARRLAEWYATQDNGGPARAAQSGTPAGDRPEILAALAKLETSGPGRLRREAAALMARASRFADAPPVQSGDAPPPPMARGFRFALVPNLGPVRTFSHFLRRDGSAYDWRIFLILPNLSRIEFDVRLIGTERNGSRFAVSGAKIYSPAGENPREITAIQDKSRPGNIVLADGEPFLALSLVEEVRRDEVASVTNQVHVDGGSIVRLGTSSAFGEEPPQSTRDVKILGASPLKTSSEKSNTSRHAMDVLFSDGITVRVRFNSTHHVGGDLERVSAVMAIPTASGDVTERAQATVSWGVKAASGTIYIRAADRGLEISLGYSEKGSGGISVTSVLSKITNEAWRMAEYPPAEVEARARMLQTRPTEKTPAGPAPVRPAVTPTVDDSDILFQIGSILRAGQVEKVKDHVEIGSRGVYTGGRDSPWQVTVNFAKGEKKGDVVSASYNFPGETGEFDVLPIVTDPMDTRKFQCDGGSLLFAKEGSRYEGCVFFVPHGNMKASLFEVTPRSIRMDTARGFFTAPSDAPQTDNDDVRLYLYFLNEKLPEYKRQLAEQLAEKAGKAQAQIVEPISAPPPEPQFDPHLNWLMSFGAKMDSKDVHPRGDGYCLHEFKGLGISKLVLGLSPQLEIAEGLGAYRLSGKPSDKTHLLVAVRAGGLIYLYLLGPLLGVVFSLDPNHPHELTEVTSSFVRERLLGSQIRRRAWNVSDRPDVILRKMEMAQGLTDIARQWRSNQTTIRELMMVIAEDNPMALEGDRQARRSIAQSTHSSPAAVWADALPEPYRSFLGREILFDDLNSLLGGRVDGLIPFDDVRAVLMTADESDERYAGAADAHLKAVIARTAYQLLHGERSEILRELIAHIRAEEATGKGRRFLPFVDRLIDYLGSVLLDNLSDLNLSDTNLGAVEVRQALGIPASSTLEGLGPQLAMCVTNTALALGFTPALPLIKI